MEDNKMITQTITMKTTKSDLTGRNEVSIGSGFMSLFKKQVRASSGVLILVQFMICMSLVMFSVDINAQEAESNPMMQSSAYAQHTTNIFNYTTTYNSGKVFVNWTAKDEPLDCIYIIERSSDGRQFESVGVKEGIGTNLELFYSWMDHTPPAGFAYYRVKKITKDGSQMYSATNTIINQGSSFDQKSNYARGTNGEKTDK